MAKGQKRGNREDRKPKMNKPKVVAAAAPALAKGLLSPTALPKRKG